MSNITLDKSGALKVQTPYSAQLVAAIKSLPVSDRKYDPVSRVWLVATDHGSKVVDWIAQYIGEMVLLPQAAKQAARETTDIFECRYIGMTRDKGGDERTASGWVNGEWLLVFPENVLRAWFDQAATPGDESNLYAILSIHRDTTPDVIKSAYRRLARQWHPDVCREPNAADQFRKIQHAYEILSNDNARAKYNAGLALQAMTKPERGSMVDYKVDTGYRSPLRCGLLLVNGFWRLGRFVVSKVLQWEDIANGRGQTLVTSWQMGADTFSEAWV